VIGIYKFTPTFLLDKSEMATVQGIHSNYVRLSEQLERTKTRCKYWNGMEAMILGRIRKALTEKRFDLMGSLEDEYKAVWKVVHEYMLYGARKAEEIMVERCVLDILVEEEEGY
jgi:hypothetical protein